MSQSINLVPQTEQVEQQQVKLVKLSTVVSILVLLAVGGVTYFYYNKTQNLKSDIAAKDQSIEASRAQIKNMSAIEITARNLATRSAALNEVFANRPYYSLLLQEFKKRLPPSIFISNFTLSGENKFTISGDADNYIAIASFIRDLTNPKFEGAERGLETLFTDVTLNSVNLETRNNRASYFINVTYDMSKLTK